MPKESEKITLKITCQQYRVIILALRSFCEEMQESQATQPLCDNDELIRQSIMVREELIRQRDQQRRQMQLQLITPADM